jgi:hypothetical protein
MASGQLSAAVAAIKEKLQNSSRPENMIAQSRALLAEIDRAGFQSPLNQL